MSDPQWMARWAVGRAGFAWFERRRNNQCFYCRRKLDPKRAPTPLRKTRDHIMPRARDGVRKRNMVPACAECNERKGNRTLSEYRCAARIAVFAGELHWPRHVTKARQREKRELTLAPLANGRRVEGEG